MPAELETYSLIQLGLTLTEADEIEAGRALELLAIHSVVEKHRAKESDG